jgi:hypothetical protein
METRVIELLEAWGILHHEAFWLRIRYPGLIMGLFDGRNSHIQKKLRDDGMYVSSCSFLSLLSWQS